MNLARIWDLPVVFVCENNGYAQTTPVRYHSSVPRIADRAAGYGMPGQVVDGLDVVAVRSAAATAAADAAAGRGPTLIEATTWRFYGHFEGDQQMYRPAEERTGFDAVDPLSRFGRWILQKRMATNADLESGQRDARAQVEEALAFARASAFPDLSESSEYVYASHTHS
jgi:TPP-dependent pyruvate/acetoin dehydrogenase alpha subunit